MIESLIADESKLSNIIDGLSEKIIEECNLEGVVLVGIKSRGVPIAERIRETIRNRTNVDLHVGILDINLYRDDLTELDDQPQVNQTELSFKVENSGIILVDDVLYTGRTIRAAMDELIDFGRPRFIKLLVLVDRGWREFPIEANFVGIKINTSLNDNIKVMLKPLDDENKIIKRTKLN